MEEMKFCQSCAMPLTKSEDFGTNADQSRNEEYCRYCYENGKFTSELSMEEFLESCIPFSLQAGVYLDAETARKEMRKYYPTLKRWKEAVK